MPNVLRDRCWITATTKLPVVEIDSTMILITTAAKKFIPIVSVVTYVHPFVSVVNVQQLIMNNFYNN